MYPLSGFRGVLEPLQPGHRVDFRPSVVRVNDIGAGCLYVCADGRYGNPVRVAFAGFFRLRQRDGIGTHDLDYKIPVLLLAVRLVHQGILPGIQLDQKVLIAISVGSRFLNDASDRYARRQFPQASRIIYMIPQRLIAVRRCKP